jgi:hypothetical protein
MQLSSIVPWGRSYQEYAAMFALSESDIRRRILGCGDGPASFNAELTSAGGQVVSVDPLYEFDAAAIERRFEEVAPGIVAQVRQNPSDWVWSFHHNPDELLGRRRQTLQRFLGDYASGKLEGRYLAEALPALPFAASTFDLALCSHLLFLYSAHLSEQFHVDSALELCRVAQEVRIFPLVTLTHERSPHVPAVLEAVCAQGFHPQVIRVPYEFQRGANEMLLIQRDSARTARP